MSALKILQINTEKGWRGGERQTLFTMKGLARAGQDVRLVCLRDSPLARRARAESLAVSEVKTQAGALRFLATQGRDFDILHAQTGRGQSLAVMTRPLHGRRIVYTRRVDFVPRGTLSLLKYHYTHQTVAISQAIKDILEGTLPGRQVEVIPSCLDTTVSLRSPSAEALSLKKRLTPGKIIACAAALVPHKDPLTLVRAAARLRDESDLDFVIVHFGRGPMKAEVRREISRLGLKRSYLLMGFEQDLESFFPVFDLFVMSSQEEGLGSSVLDAFRYRVPVVSTDAGGLKDLVSGRGLICPVGDPVCLARSMARVLRSPEAFQDMTSKARAYVVREHSLEEMTRRYIRLYREVLNPAALT